ncbi:MAG TPA: hypothetical protein VE135_29285 [Pyrinomonadaceae bacterium]|nr:hypothetical protein [Pyrinomonadaceae bacterium]
MSSPADWLPELITLDSCGGDWEKYVEVVYAKFVQDFMGQRLTFEGQRLTLRRHPIVRGKEASFWHLVSEGDKEEDRLPDMDRCARIGWTRAIIDHAASNCVKKWENKRGGNTNICLWVEQEGYLVILGKRTGYTLLLTGYIVPPRRDKKLRKEYEDFCSSQNS